MNTTFHAPEVFLIHIGTCNSNRHLHCNDTMVELGNLALGLNDECTNMVVLNVGRKVNNLWFQSSNYQNSFKQRRRGWLKVKVSVAGIKVK